eukprot:14166652-Alexandrium_andersonii.AAC.1
MVGCSRSGTRVQYCLSRDCLRIHWGPCKISGVQATASPRGAGIILSLVLSPFLPIVDTPERAPMLACSP